MKRIFYASGSVVTGDRTAAAVLAYARALAMRETSDSIDIPVVTPAGTEGRAQLVIGPASQLMVVTEVMDRDELDDDDAIAAIDKHVEGLLTPESRPLDPGQFDENLDTD